MYAVSGGILCSEWRRTLQWVEAYIAASGGIHIPAGSLCMHHVAASGGIHTLSGSIHTLSGGIHEVEAYIEWRHT